MASEPTPNSGPVEGDNEDVGANNDTGSELISLEGMKEELVRLGASAEGCVTPEDCLKRLLELQASLESTTGTGVAPSAAGTAAVAPPSGLQAEQALQLPPPGPPEGCVPGGREVDEHDVNIGVLRCLRCGTRLVTKKATLVERWFGGSSSSSESTAETSDYAISDPDGKAHGLPIVSPSGPSGAWAEARYRWWWRLADHNDFDAVGMSAVHAIPDSTSQVRYPLCPECMLRPLGLQQQEQQQSGGSDGAVAAAPQQQQQQAVRTNEVLVACALVGQQPTSLANDAQDFAPPAHLSGETLAQLLAQGRGRTTFSVTFPEQRLGMVLQDVLDPQAPPAVEEGDSAPPEAVEVGAFTVGPSGELGAAELGGEVMIGDRVTRVNDQSCLNLNYAAVLDLIVGAPRPITLHFERLAAKPGLAGLGGESSSAAAAAAETVAGDAATAGSTAAAAEGGGTRVMHEDWHRP